MKLRITWRYFLFLTLFNLGSFILFFAFDILHEHLPKRLTHEGEPGGDTREFIFLLGLNVAALPAILGLAWIAVRRMVRPLAEVRDVAEAISDGRLGGRIPSAGLPDDELAGIVHSLNRAFARYDEVLERQRRFAGNAAHQLRTPLAAMRAELEISLARPRDAAESREALLNVLDRLLLLNRLCEQMLDLSRLGAGHHRIAFSLITPSEVAARTVEDFLPLAEHAGLRLSAPAACDVRMKGDALLLGQALANLLDNAIRLTPSGGTILLGVRRLDEEWLALEVEDSGPGIPPESRARVFETFYQGEEPSAGRAGLGLALVAEIARLHGGRAEAFASRLGGALIRLSFPVARQPIVSL